MSQLDSVPVSWSELVSDFIAKHYKQFLASVVVVGVGVAGASPLLDSLREMRLPAASMRAAVGAATNDEFRSNLQPVDNVILSESPSVLNVSPRVEPDPNGGFLIADADEAQVRRYSEDGKLLSVFGRKGNGPGEFLRLSSALRTANGAIAAVEINGRLSLFESDGKHFLRSWQTGLGPVYQGTSVGDSLIVLAGRAGGRIETDLLHMWDVRRGEVVRSFFRTPVAPPGLESAFWLAGSSAVAVRGDTLAAVFALADSVYLYGLDGRLLEKIHIPFRHFRSLREPLPSMGSITGYRKWSSKFSAISRIFWTSEGDFLVHYYDTDGVSPAWRLLRMDRRGHRKFEMVDSPELLAISGTAETTLFFVDPQSLTPNVWLAAGFRR
jgi:hypothetical protein